MSAPDGPCSVCNDLDPTCEHCHWEFPPNAEQRLRALLPKCPTCAGQTRYENDGWVCPDCDGSAIYEAATTDADLLDAIDALHYRVVHRPSKRPICRYCREFWPCTTARLLHPEEKQ
jgi:hypothetical protein